MAPAADPQPETTSPVAAPAAPGRSRWAQLADNPLMTILGTATVGLLIFTLTRTENRISRLEDRMDAGFAAVDARFAAVDARFDAQDAKIDEINRKLTALIAALNATDEIQAALEGRLLEPATEDAEPSAPGPG